ncbi:hypothetical protein [Glycomyces sp. TRM65418]|uniref:hypothetical protein n=1 Tax=Glycomyces sp. TRM65418 TaxID=2867006 RepID=UPI0035ABA483
MARRERVLGPDGGGIQIHQYAPSTIDATVDGARFALTVATAYPEDGAVTVRVEANEGGERTMSLRVPAWAEGARLTGPDGEARTVAAGAFTAVTAACRPGDEIRLDLPVRPRWTFPDPRIDAVRGCAAVERGPVVLCAESIDLPGGADVADLSVDASAVPLERDGRVYVSAGVVLERGHDRPDTWPYGPPAAADEGKSAEVPLIPFHLRATRAPAPMRVWLPLAP